MPSPSSGFGTWDAVVVAVYFLAMAAIGWYFSRRNRDFSEFMFARQSLPWMAVGISLIATSVSATTFLGNPADAYAHDLRLLLLNVGSLLSIALVAWIFIPRYRKAGIQSAYELLEHRLGRRVRLFAAILYCGHLLLRTGLLIYIPCLVIAPILGLPVWACIVAMAGVAILYTYYGGIQAVTWTDVVQFLILFGGGLWALAYLAQAAGGWGEAFSAAGQAGKLRWFDATWNPGDARNLWSAGLVYAVFETAIRGCDQQFVQRYLSCRDVKAANLSSLVSALFGIAVGLLFFLIGSLLYVFYVAKGLAPVPSDDINRIFPHFILNRLPTGLRGLLIAAILAAAMSSLSSALTALSNTAVADFRPRLLDGSQGLRAARRAVLGFGVLGMGAAFLSMLGSVSLLHKALFFTSLFTGPLLALFLMAFFMPRVSGKAAGFGALLGMATLLPFLNIPILPPGVWEPLYRFSWPWNPLISLTATLLWAILIEGGRAIFAQSQQVRT